MFYFIPPTYIKSFSALPVTYTAYYKRMMATRPLYLDLLFNLTYRVFFNYLKEQEKLKKTCS